MLKKRFIVLLGVSLAVTFACHDKSKGFSYKTAEDGREEVNVSPQRVFIPVGADINFEAKSKNGLLSAGYHASLTEENGLIKQVKIVITEAPPDQEALVGKTFSLTIFQYDENGRPRLMEQYYEDSLALRKIFTYGSAGVLKNTEINRMRQFKNVRYSLNSSLTRIGDIFLEDGSSDHQQIVTFNEEGWPLKVEYCVLFEADDEECTLVKEKGYEYLNGKLKSVKHYDIKTRVETGAEEIEYDKMGLPVMAVVRMPGSASQVITAEVDPASGMVTGVRVDIEEGDSKTRLTISNIEYQEEAKPAYPFSIYDMEQDNLVTMLIGMIFRGDADLMVGKWMETSLISSLPYTAPPEDNPQPKK